MVFRASVRREDRHLFCVQASHVHGSVEKGVQKIRLPALPEINDFNIYLMDDVI